MKNFIVFLFIIQGANIGFSQNSITGKISDSQNTALTYANVILYKMMITLLLKERFLMTTVILDSKMSILVAIELKFQC